MEEQPAAASRTSENPQVGLEAAIHRLSLTFQDPKVEDGFVNRRRDRLLESTFKASVVVSAVLCYSLVHHLLSSNPEFEGSDGERVRWIMMVVWLTELFMFLAFTAVSGYGRWCVMPSRWSRWCCANGRRCTPATSRRRLRLPRSLIEVSMTAALNLSILAAFFSNHWYLAKLLSLDPAKVYQTDYFSDTFLFLMIAAMITASHIWLPIRWWLLCSTEIVTAVICGYGMVFLGSPEDYPEYSFAVLCVIVLVTSFGLRSQEWNEREGHLMLVHTPGMMPSVPRLHPKSPTHMSDMSWYQSSGLLSFKGSKGKEMLDDDFKGGNKTTETIETNITAATGSSGRVFRVFNKPLEHYEAKTQMETLRHMGVREHWCVSQDDVRVWPNSVIGVGGFGCVVVAELHGAQVAMKVYRHRPGKDILGSFANELRVGRRLRHPHIVTFYGACIDPFSGHLALLFGWIRRGYKLEKYIAPWNEARGPNTQHRKKVLQDLTSALRYLHGQEPPVVHGDLKPGNILVEINASEEAWQQDPQTKLLDFGLSRVLGSQPKPLGGTRGWRAPETLEGPAVAPKASADVYSIGLLAMFVMTGLRIVADPQATQSEAEQWPPQCPLIDEVKRLCKGCSDTGRAAAYRGCLEQVPAHRPGIVHVHEEIQKWDLTKAPHQATQGQLHHSAHGPQPTGPERPLDIPVKEQVAPVDFNAGVNTVEAMMARVGKSFENEISASFDFFDEAKNIISASPGWIEFCGHPVGPQESMLHWFPNGSAIWQWMTDQVQNILGGGVPSGDSSEEAESQQHIILPFQQQGNGRAASDQVKCRRSDDPECVEHLIKVAVSFPLHTQSASSESPEGEPYIVTLLFWDVTTQVVPSVSTLIKPPALPGTWTAAAPAAAPIPTHLPHHDHPAIDSGKVLREL